MKSTLKLRRKTWIGHLLGNSPWITTIRDGRVEDKHRRREASDGSHRNKNIHGLYKRRRKLKRIVLQILGSKRNKHILNFQDKVGPGLSYTFALVFSYVIEPSLWTRDEVNVSAHLSDYDLVRSLRIVVIGYRAERIEIRPKKKMANKNK